MRHYSLVQLFYQKEETFYNIKKDFILFKKDYIYFIYLLKLRGRCCSGSIRDGCHLRRHVSIIVWGYKHVLLLRHIDKIHCISGVLRLVLKTVCVLDVMVLKFVIHLGGNVVLRIGKTLDKGNVGLNGVLEFLKLDSELEAVRILLGNGCKLKVGGGCNRALLEDDLARFAKWSSRRLGHILKNLPEVTISVVGQFNVSPAVKGFSNLIGGGPGGKVDKPAADVNALVVDLLGHVDVVNVPEVEVAHVPEHLLLGDALLVKVGTKGIWDVKDLCAGGLVVTRGEKSVEKRRVGRVHIFFVFFVFYVLTGNRLEVYGEFTL